MPSLKLLTITFGVAAVLSTLAAFARASQEYLSSTCALANCNNCRQSLEPSSSSCPANVPNRCYSTKNDSAASTGAWCVKSASQTPPNCSITSTGSTSPHPCGELKYWNCGCVASGGGCNFCPCPAGSHTGSWTPSSISTNTCTNY